MSKKVKPLLRGITVSSTSWATNVLTINTTGDHGLLTGDKVSFGDQNTPEIYRDLTITVTDTDTFTVPMTDKYCKIPPVIYVDTWNVGATGAQDVFTFGLSTPPAGLVQVVSNTGATATVKVEGSLDGSHWTDIAAAAALSSGGSVFVDITKPYAYGRLNFTVAVAGAGGKVKAYLGV